MIHDSHVRYLSVVRLLHQSQHNEGDVVARFARSDGESMRIYEQNERNVNLNVDRAYYHVFLQCFYRFRTNSVEKNFLDCVYFVNSASANSFQSVIA